jgi:hypothetical protein
MPRLEPADSFLPVETFTEDTMATAEDNAAMIMAMGAAGTLHEARRALEESGGNVDQAISLLDRSRKVGASSLHHDDDGVDKRSRVTRGKVQGK